MSNTLKVLEPYDGILEGSGIMRIARDKNYWLVLEKIGLTSPGFKKTKYQFTARVWINVEPKKFQWVFMGLNTSQDKKLLGSLKNTILPICIDYKSPSEFHLYYDGNMLGDLYQFISRRGDE